MKPTLNKEEFNKLAELFPEDWTDFSEHSMALIFTRLYFSGLPMKNQDEFATTLALLEEVGIFYKTDNKFKRGEYKEPSSIVVA